MSRSPRAADARDRAGAPTPRTVAPRPPRATPTEPQRAQPHRQFAPPPALRSESGMLPRSGPPRPRGAR